MKKLFIVLLLISGSVLAKEGGNGGVGIICRDDTGEITKAEMLDSFELRNLHGLTESQFLTEEEALEQLSRRLNMARGYRKLFFRHYERISKSLRVLEEGVRIIPTEDAFPILKQDNCSFEQLAVYTDSHKVLVDRELFSKLNLFNLIALKVHETVYFLARELRSETSSKISREFTSYLLSKEYDGKALFFFTNQYNLNPRNFLLDYLRNRKNCKFRVRPNSVEVIDRRGRDCELN